MGLLVHVGTESDLPPVPENFPRCGNWPNQFEQAPSTPKPSTTSGTIREVQPFILAYVFALIVQRIVMG